MHIHVCSITNSYVIINFYYCHFLSQGPLTTVSITSPSTTVLPSQGLPLSNLVGIIVSLVATVTMAVLLTSIILIFV